MEWHDLRGSNYIDFWSIKFLNGLKSSSGSRISGGGGRGAPTPKMGRKLIILARFSWKLREIEKKLDRSAP